MAWPCTKGLSGMMPFACVIDGTQTSYHPTASVTKVWQLYVCSAEECFFQSDTMRLGTWWLMSWPRCVMEWELSLACHQWQKSCWPPNWANREDEASHGIVVENFGGRDRQRAFFDVWVFNPFARSHCQHSPEPVLSLLWEIENLQTTFYNNFT